MKGIIYKVTNNLDGQTYIGSTTKSIEERKIDHEQKANNGNGGYFQNAIATCGVDSFHWEQIDTANDVNELAQKEKKYILDYKSLENGFNKDSGGGFKKKIYQYCTQTGKLISTYASLETAAKAINASKKSISNTCLGQNKTCKGFYWSYELKEPFFRECDLRNKEVLQLDSYGRFIQNFKSVSEASRKTGVSKSCIARVCRGEREMSQGFKWMYNIRKN